MNSSSLRALSSSVAGRGRRAADADGDVVTQAVLDEDVPQPEEARRAAHNDYDGGVQHVHQQGEAAERQAHRALHAREQRKEEVHHEGEQHVHAVVPLPALGARVERLGQHQRKGQHEPGGLKADTAPLGHAHLRAEEHEHGREEQAVARVAHQGKQRVICAAHAGDAFDKSPVAVAQQAEDVQRRDDGGADAAACHAHQQRGQPRAQKRRGEVPEVVERALKEHLLHEVEQSPALEMPGVDVDGQVQRRAGGVDNGGLFKEAPHAGALGQDKIARDHEEKRHGHTGDHAREDKVRGAGVASERGGVYRNNQKRRHDSEYFDALIGTR